MPFSENQFKALAGPNNTIDSDLTWKAYEERIMFLAAIAKEGTANAAAAEKALKIRARTTELDLSQLDEAKLKEKGYDVDKLKKIAVDNKLSTAELRTQYIHGFTRNEFLAPVLPLTGDKLNEALNANATFKALAPEKQTALLAKINAQNEEGVKPGSLETAMKTAQVAVDEDALIEKANEEATAKAAEEAKKNAPLEDHDLRVLLNDNDIYLDSNRDQQKAIFKGLKGKVLPDVAKDPAKLDAAINKILSETKPKTPEAPAKPKTVTDYSYNVADLQRIFKDNSMGEGKKWYRAWTGGADKDLIKQMRAQGLIDTDRNGKETISEDKLLVFFNGKDKTKWSFDGGSQVIKGISVDSKGKPKVDFFGDKDAAKLLGRDGNGTSLSREDLLAAFDEITTEDKNLKRYVEANKKDPNHAGEAFIKETQANARKSFLIETTREVPVETKTEGSSRTPSRDSAKPVALNGKTVQSMLTARDADKNVHTEANTLSVANFLGISRDARVEAVFRPRMDANSKVSKQDWESWLDSLPGLSTYKPDAKFYTEPKAEDKNLGELVKKLMDDVRAKNSKTGCPCTDATALLDAGIFKEVKTA